MTNKNITINKKMGIVIKTFMFVALALFICLSAKGSEAQAATKKKLNKTSVTLDIGQKVKLKVKNNAAKVKWVSANRAIAKVTQYGNVYAVGEGSCIVTAIVGKRRFKCTVTVRSAGDLMPGYVVYDDGNIRLTLTMIQKSMSIPDIYLEANKSIFKTKYWHAEDYLQTKILNANLRYIKINGVKFETYFLQSDYYWPMSEDNVRYSEEYSTDKVNISISYEDDQKDKFREMFDCGWSKSLMNEPPYVGLNSIELVGFTYDENFQF